MIQKLFANTAPRPLMAVLLTGILVGLGFLSSGCGKKKCEKNADCPKDTACIDGQCVSLKGGPPPRGPNPFNRRAAQRKRPGKPDPNKVYRVDVDPKKHPMKGPADALVTMVEISEFQ